MLYYTEQSKYIHKDIHYITQRERHTQTKIFAYNLYKIQSEAKTQTQKHSYTHTNTNETKLKYMHINTKTHTKHAHTFADMCTHTVAILGA